MYLWTQSLRLLVMICATLLNTQTLDKTAFDWLMLLAPVAELIKNWLTLWFKSSIVAEIWSSVRNELLLVSVKTYRSCF